MKLTIVSDDKSTRRGILRRHSFSIVVERSDVFYMFGLASDPSVLEHNSRRLGLDLSLLDYVIVSHEHRSHYGGYRYVAEEAPYISAFIPYGTMESLGRLFNRSGLRAREVMRWTALDEGVYVSGPYEGPPHEHFLVIDQGSELVVLSGCLHPGPLALIDVSNYLGKRVGTIIGGFHLMNAPNNVVENYARVIAEVIRPRTVIPLHCSGERFINDLKSKYNVEVMEMGAGDVLVI